MTAAPPTRVRALTESGVFIEGWAVYTEELMAGLGFGGLPVRLQQLKMQLRMTINALLDQLVHCEDLPEAEALALMTGRGFQEEGEAAGKWRRALLTSTQLSTYFVGRTAFYRLRQAVQRELGDAFQLGRYHEAVLAHGTLPVKYLPELVREELRTRNSSRSGPVRSKE